MAESSDGVGSWPGFVAQVNKTFNLLRDVFGYALPGGVFLAIGLISKRFSLSDVDDLLSPYHPPAWAYFILAMGACYVIGDILAATAYMPISVLKWVVWEGSRFRRWVKDRDWLKKCKKTRDWLKVLDQKVKDWPKNWLEHNPTEVAADLLVIRSRREPMFSSLDRRETLAILSGSTSIALLGGWYIFFRANWDGGAIFRWAGIIVLLQFATGMSHLRRVADAIRKADDTLTDKESKVPDASADKLAVAVSDAAGKLIQATKKALTA